MDNLEVTENSIGQYQRAGSEMLARTIADALNECGWVNSNHKILFCILFMQKILESKLEVSDNIALIRKIKKKPINFLIRFLKRYPDKGLKLLSQSVMDELRENQKLKLGELVQFHTALLDLLFPPPAN